MLKIGITGGIGVGKTYVSNIIEKMGYPVFYADQTAKDLVKSDYKLIESIKKEFGHDIFLNEKIDSKKLSNIVFGDSNALNKLNSIIHPFVFEKFAEWCKNQKMQKKLLVLIQCQKQLKQQMKVQRIIKYITVVFLLEI